MEGEAAGQRVRRIGRWDARARGYLCRHVVVTGFGDENEWSKTAGNFMSCQPCSWAGGLGVLHQYVGTMKCRDCLRRAVCVENRGRDSDWLRHTLVDRWRTGALGWWIMDADNLADGE